MARKIVTALACADLNLKNSAAGLTHKDKILTVMINFWWFTSFVCICVSDSITILFLPILQICRDANLLELGCWVEAQCYFLISW